MKLQVERYSLRIVPEGPVDEAYLEEVIGLRQEGDSVPLRRVNAMGLSCWGHAETVQEVQEVQEVQDVPKPDQAPLVFGVHNDIDTQKFFDPGTKLWWSHQTGDAFSWVEAHAIRDRQPGWRLPTAVELVAMSWTWMISSWTWSSTYLKEHPEVRYVYAVRAGRTQLFSSADRCYVRLVQEGVSDE